MQLLNLSAINLTKKLATKLRKGTRRKKICVICVICGFLFLYDRGAPYLRAKSQELTAKSRFLVFFLVLGRAHAGKFFKRGIKDRFGIKSDIKGNLH